jgi:tetratricopeptide (TPR) repeat protein
MPGEGLTHAPVQQESTGKEPHIAVDIDPQKPPARWIELDTQPLRAKPASGDQRPDAASLDTVLKLLSAFVDAWSHDLMLAPVAPILKALGEQSIVARQKLEFEALRAVGTLFETGLFGRQMGRLLRILREWQKTGVAPVFSAPGRKRPRETTKTVWRAVGLVGVLLFAFISAIMNTRSPGPRSTPSGNGPFYTPAPPPNPATASFNRGVRYDSTGQFDQAIREYDNAIRLNPYYAPTYYNRGLDYANQGQFDRAIQDYDQAMRLNPGNPDNLVSRGTARGNMPMPSRITIKPSQ